jgi:hypothetical protein
MVAMQTATAVAAPLPDQPNAVPLLAVVPMARDELQVLPDRASRCTTEQIFASALARHTRFRQSFSCNRQSLIYAFVTPSFFT